MTKIFQKYDIAALKSIYFVIFQQNLVWMCVFFFNCSSEAFKIECMPLKWFESFDVVAEMTRPDFHTNRIWQPHRPTLCLSPVATISLPEPVSVWTVWVLTWSVVPLDEELNPTSIDWTKPVIYQKHWGRKQAKTAAPCKQAGPLEGVFVLQDQSISLCLCVWNVLHTLSVWIPWFLQAALSYILTSHRMFNDLCIIDEMLESGMKDKRSKTKIYFSHWKGKK